MVAGVSVLAKCRVCGRRAVYWVPWANTWFCKEHFVEYFKRRVIRTYEKYFPKNHERILVAVSGGKDSVALLHSLTPHLLDKGLKVSALFIDLGIKNYSQKAYRIVYENTHKLGIPLIVTRLADHGFTIDYVAYLVVKRIIRRPVCSICGLVKRYLMNKTAVEKGFDLILTGHTLNDALAFATQNIYSGNIYDLVKLKPYIPGRDGLVARGKPLLFVYEAETKWFVEAVEAPVLDVKCPHTPRTESIIIHVKKSLEELDEKHPGYMSMAMKNIVDKLIPLLEEKLPKPRLVKCRICGMPSSTDPCGFCRLKIRISKYRLGRISS